MIYINKQRNVFAHHILDTSSEGLDLFNNKGIIQFAQFRDNETLLTPFTEDEIEKILKLLKV